MFIDQTKMMIVPKTTKRLVPTFKGSQLIVNHFVENGVLVKRVEAIGKEAVVFNGSSNQIANRYSVDFDLINALFVTFTPNSPEDYLCLIGSTQIDFYALADQMYCSLALPFKICQATSVSFGLLLERSTLPGEFGSSPCAAQLFSLTHPYNEIFPILCKFKDEPQCHYTFRNRKMKVVSKDAGANWTPFFGANDLVMCYDFEEHINHIFLIRKCTKDERMAAKNDLGIMNSSALLHTPSSMQSFYSPNFFNRRFIENQLGAPNNVNYQSPYVPINPLTFSNTSQSQSKQRHQSAGTSNGASVAAFSSKVTPVRRYYTRSIAAAERTAFAANPNTFSGAVPSHPSTTEKSPVLRSLEHSATLNRMKLKKKLALVASGSSLYTPRQIDLSDLLSFGGRDDDADDPPASLDMAVEFCLHWLWAESPDENVLGGAVSSLGTEKVASKLQRLRVSSSASSHSEDKGEANRMASTFFVCRSVFDKNDRYIVFHVPHDRRVRILRLAFAKGRDNLPFAHSPVPPNCSVWHLSSFRASGAIPFLHSPYFMVLDAFGLSDDQFFGPPSVALYHGLHKLGAIALNIGLNAHLLYLLPAGRCPKGFNLFALQAIIASEEEIGSEVHFEQFETQHFLYKLQLGFVSEMGNRCFHAICATLKPDHQLDILARLICTNTWRIILAAEQIPCINELPAERVELALLFELIFNHFGTEPTTELPYRPLLCRIRRHMSEDLQEGSANKRTRLNDFTVELTKNDEFWNKLREDSNLIQSVSDLNDKCIRHLYQAKILERRVLNFLRKLVKRGDKDMDRKRVGQGKSVVSTASNRLTTANACDWKQNFDDVHKWVTAPRWTMDLRLHNVKQMLDPSLPILIPDKAFGLSFNDVQQREQHEQFLVSVAIRTLTRPFGQALLHFRTRHFFSDTNLDPAMGMRQICLNGRVHPGRNQVDYPLNDSFPTHKSAMDWANFYNALAHGLSFCGDFPQRLFSIGPSENELPSTVRAGLILAAGFAGNLRNMMNLYDIHLLLTQNNRHLVIALLVGCAAAHRGTSEVHIYKIIATHLPFLLQPTLCEFRIDLVVQTAALVSLGLLFCETTNHTVSSQLLNQMSLEVPCESDQSADRYSFVLAAGFAIGLINLGKGKEISDTEIPISSSPSLKDRLIKLLKGGERRMAYLNYDQVQCPCMRSNNVVGPRMAGAGSSLGRAYTPGGGGGIEGMVESFNGDTSKVRAEPPAGSGADHSNGGTSGQATARHVDRSGIGQPTSSHVRELHTLNIHLTSPAAAVALGLIYLRTGDSWIRETLAIADTFYEIDQIRPDMLMVRTFSRCLVDFDDIKCTRAWFDAQIPRIICKYVKRFLDVKSKEDMWWSEFIDMGTVAKAYFYCYAGASFALALRFASKWEIKALRLIQNFYEMLKIDTDEQNSSSGGPSSANLANQAGQNCINACVNVCALSMALVMAGSGDLQTTRILRKIRNTFDKIGEAPIPRDTSVHSSHVCANMALGLLYLGHGRLCFSDSNLAIASLVISLFPLFPHSIVDNRFFFQSIRFFWVLAVCPSPRSETVKDGELERSDVFARQTVNCSRCGNVTVNKCF